MGQTSMLLAEVSVPKRSSHLQVDMHHRRELDDAEWWVALGQDPDTWDAVVRAYKQSPRRKKCSLRDFASGYLASRHAQLAEFPPTRLAIVLPIASARFRCDVCRRELTERRFHNGQTWSPAELARRGRDRFGQTLCAAHYHSVRKAVKTSNTVPQDHRLTPRCAQRCC